MTVRLPALVMAPPEVVELPPVIVSPVRVAVVPGATENTWACAAAADRQAVGGRAVDRLAGRAGVRQDDGAEGRRERDGLGRGEAPDVSNTTVLGRCAFGARFAGLALVLRLAQAIAERSVPMSVESVVVLTR